MPKSAVTRAPLTDGAGALLEVLIATRRVLVPLANLARKCDCDEQVLADRLAELLDDLAVEVWPMAPRGPSVCLSARTMRERRLEFSDDGHFWRRRKTPRHALRAEPSQEVARCHVPPGVDPAVMDWDDRRPVPRILLGERLQWDGPRATHRANPCPGCLEERNRERATGAVNSNRYCLCCDDLRPPRQPMLLIPEPKPGQRDWWRSAACLRGDRAKPK